MAFMSIQLGQDVIDVELPLSHYYFVYTNYQPINSLTHLTRSFMFSVDRSTALQQSTLKFVCTETKPT